ncbi:hypothetical protein A4G99_10970 [Haladaptatus sp. R4]|uniref:Yip1 family protein n=1 Tax=Haladaptatus sp. R4 TaxID=1679489 RepID=UPI0007B49F7B|nr:Yip1 family protein [Haladaptatus sp. R4]KZN24836.1 hypothetical protein A4G99_10970 [Haladaptatus sp. R4]
MVLKLLTEPESFFRDRVENPGILIPTVIVLLVALVAAVGTVPRANISGQFASTAVQSQGQQMNQSMSNAIGGVASTVTIVFSFVGILLAWAVYSIAFYAIARFAFGGSGSLGDTFAFTGWGYVPLFIHQVIGAIAAYYVYSGVNLPSNDDAAMTAFQNLQSDPALFVAGIVGVVLLLWSGWIWTTGMEKLHDLSRRNAVITVGIPVGIAVILRISGLV